MKTTVVNCRNSDYDVYVGRPTYWGNPFEIGVHGTRKQVIEKYRQYVTSQPAMMEQIPTLRGKRLGCWCAPKPCHADVLAELANA